MKKLWGLNSFFSYLIALNLMVGCAVLIPQNGDNEQTNQGVSEHNSGIESRANTAGLVVFQMQGPIFNGVDFAKFAFAIESNTMADLSDSEIQDIVTNAYIQIYDVNDDPNTEEREGTPVISQLLDQAMLDGKEGGFIKGLQYSQELDLTGLDSTKTNYVEIKWQEKGMASDEWYYTNRNSFEMPKLSMPKLSFSQKYTGVHQVEEQILVDFNEDTTGYELNDIFSKAKVSTISNGQSDILSINSDDERYNIEHIDNEDFIINFWMKDIESNSNNAENITFDYQWKQSTFGGNESGTISADVKTRDMYSSQPNVAIEVETFEDKLEYYFDWTNAVVNFTIDDPSDGEWMFDTIDGTSIVPSFFELKRINLINEIYLKDKATGVKLEPKHDPSPSAQKGSFWMEELTPQTTYNWTFVIDWVDGMMKSDYMQDFTFKTPDKMEAPVITQDYGTAPTEIEKTKPQEYFTTYTFSLDASGKDITDGTGFDTDKDKTIGFTEWTLINNNTGEVEQSNKDSGLTYDQVFNNNYTLYDLKPGTEYSLHLEPKFTQDPNIEQIYSAGIRPLDITFNTNGQLSAPKISNIVFSDIDTPAENDFITKYASADLESTSPLVSFVETDDNYFNPKVFFDKITMTYSPIDDVASSTIVELPIDQNHWEGTLLDIVPDLSYQYNIEAHYTKVGKTVFLGNSDSIETSGTFSAKTKIAEPTIVVNDVIYEETGSAEYFTTATLDWNAVSGDATYPIVVGDSSQFMSTANIFSGGQIKYKAQGTSEELQKNITISNTLEQTLTLNELKPATTYDYIIELNYNENMVQNVIEDDGNKKVIYSSSFSTPAKLGAPIIKVNAEKPELQDGTTSKYKTTLSTEIIGPAEEDIWKNEYIKDIRFSINELGSSSPIAGYENVLIEPTDSIPVPDLKANTTYQIKTNATVEDWVVKPTETITEFSTGAKETTEFDYSLATFNGISIDDISAQNTYDNVTAELSLPASYKEGVRDDITKVELLKNGDVINSKDNPFKTEDKVIFNLSTVNPGETMSGYQFKIYTPESEIEAGVSGSIQFVDLPEIAASKTKAPEAKIKEGGTYSDSYYIIQTGKTSISGRVLFTNVQSIESAEITISDVETKEEISNKSVSKEYFEAQTTNSTSFDFTENNLEYNKEYELDIKLNTKATSEEALAFVPVTFTMNKLSFEFSSNVELVGSSYDTIDVIFRWSNLDSELASGHSYNLNIYAIGNPDNILDTQIVKPNTLETGEQSISFVGLDYGTNYEIEIQDQPYTFNTDINGKTLSTRDKELNYSAKIENIVVENEILVSFDYTWVNIVPSPEKNKKINGLSLSIYEGTPDSTGAQIGDEFNSIDVTTLNKTEGKIKFTESDWNESIKISDRTGYESIYIKSTISTDKPLYPVIDGNEWETIVVAEETIYADGNEATVTFNKDRTKLIGSNIEIGLDIKNYDDLDNLRLSFYEYKDNTWTDLYVIDEGGNFASKFVYDDITSLDNLDDKNWNAEINSKFYGLNTNGNNVRIEATIGNVKVNYDITSNDLNNSSNQLFNPNTMKVIETIDDSKTDDRYYRLSVDAEDTINLQEDVNFSKVAKPNVEIGVESKTNIEVLDAYSVSTVFGLQLETSYEDLYIKADSYLIRGLSNTDLSFLIGRYVLVTDDSTRSIDWTNTKAFFIDDFAEFPTPMNPWLISFLVLTPLILIAILIYFIWRNFNFNRRYAHMKSLAEESYSKFVNQTNNYGWNEKYDEYERLTIMSMTQLRNLAVELELYFNEDTSKQEYIDALSLLTDAELERAKASYIEYELTPMKSTEEDLSKTDDKMTKAILVYQEKKEKLLSWIDEKRYGKQREQEAIEAKNKEAIEKAKASLKTTSESKEEEEEDE